MGRITLCGKEIVIKRDDLLDFGIAGFNGNKARKFLSLLDSQHEVFVSFGGNQSNAMQVLAALTSARGKEFVCITPQPPRFLRENPMGNFAFGLEHNVRFVFAPAGSRVAELETLAREVFAQQRARYGERVLFVPQGGSEGIAMRGMDELVCELLDNFGNLACTRENGSAGLQCDKIVDFLEGTLGLSANLPKNPQSLHSHTANTNFAACSSNPTQSTPRQEGKPSAECKADSESKESLDSESKQLTESTTSKNPSEALPDSNNSACGSTSRAESMLIDSAIFATQKSHKICSASAHTTSRPCRGGKNQKKGGSSATADFSKETSFCLDKDKRGSPLVCRAKGLQAKRSKNSGGFFGALASGEGITPLFAKKQSDFENLGSIRENATLRNLESTESKADSESKAENLGSTESNAFIESSPLDSQTSTESSKILKNTQRQNLSPKEFTEFKADLESNKSLDSSLVGVQRFEDKSARREAHPASDTQECSPHNSPHSSPRGGIIVFMSAGSGVSARSFVRARDEISRESRHKGSENASAIELITLCCAGEIGGVGRTLCADFAFGSLQEEVWAMYQWLLAQGIEFDLLYDCVGFVLVKRALERGDFSEEDLAKPWVFVHSGGLMGNASQRLRYERKFGKPHFSF